MTEKEKDISEIEKNIIHLQTGIRILSDIVPHSKNPLEIVIEIDKMVNEKSKWEKELEVKKAEKNKIFER